MSTIENDPFRTEKKYIKRIDNNRSPARVLEIAKQAERIVIDFFNQHFRDTIRVRPATAFEDAGNLITETGKQIDAVAYADRGPAMCMQITTAGNIAVIKEKMRQISDNPTVRLEEMGRHDVPIPKVLIRLEPKDVEYFMRDRRFERHVDIGEKILYDTIVSLKFDLIRTQNEKEKKKIQELLDIFEGKKEHSH